MTSIVSKAYHKFIVGMTVTGDIIVSGTVDGRDIATDGTKLDLVTVTQAVDLDTVESDTTLNNTHRASDGTDHTYIDQDVRITASPTFSATTINGNITVTGTVDGRDVAADGTSLDTLIDNVYEVTIDQTNLMDDSVMTGQSDGVYAQLVRCKDFGPDNNGASYFHLKTLGGWDLGSDLLFKVYYSLNGVDNTKVVRMILDYWVINDGSSPSVGSPDGTGTDDITSSANNTGVLDIITLTNGKVANADMTTTNSMIAVRIQRQAENAADTYTGTMKILKIVAYQA